MQAPEKVQDNKKKEKKKNNDQILMIKIMKNHKKMEMELKE